MGGPIEFSQFLKWQPPKLVPIISQGLMYAGSRVIIYGKYKSLKSMVATRLCLALAEGKDWIGFQTNQQRVLYIQLEIPNPMLHRRLKQMMNGSQPTVDNLWIWTDYGIKVDSPVGQEQVEQIIQQIHPTVLVLDPIYKALTGDISSNEKMGQLIDWADGLVDKYQLSIIMVHHSKKGEASVEWGNVDDMLGGSVLMNWADTIIKIERKSRVDVNVRFEVTRHAEDEIADKKLEMNDKLDFVIPIRKV